MKFVAAAGKVFNRGALSQAFLNEMVSWARKADPALFAPNTNYDIYNKVYDVLGPYNDRTAVMLEVMRVLALFESSGNWNEGADTSKNVDNNSENEEAGAWQVSWDSRKLDASLIAWLASHGITNGLDFRKRMKTDHEAAMTYIALLLRVDIRDYDRIANGPVRRGIERQKTWPRRPALWEPHQSIYPWLSRDAVAEFSQALKG